MDVLAHIKRLVIARKIEFTFKAELERIRDSLTVEDVLESIVNANAIKKVIRSTSAKRASRREPLYVIESPTFGGTWIYTKGAIRKKGAEEVYYVFISAKLSD